MKHLVPGSREINTTWIIILTFVATLAAPVMTKAGVVRMKIDKRETIADSTEYRATVPYEVITGVFYLEIDPDNPANASITDLTLAGRNSRGKVEFSTEFELHKPVHVEPGNHRLLCLVTNRGAKLGPEYFNCQAGKNWLYSKGWSYLWCEWNCDVVPGDERLNITVPVVCDEGKPLTGKTYAEIVSFANKVVPSMPIVWGGSAAYPPHAMNDSTATLTKRQYRWDEPIEIPRDKWAFARVYDGQILPDSGSLYTEEGFAPGWLYDLVYTAKNPRLTGLGLAAIRDVVSFLRYDESDANGLANPLTTAVRYVYAWGHSQSARFLNHFLYQNFNGDEAGRMVFDGVISNCSGAGRGLFNSRFAQTTRHGSHHEDNLYPVDVFPFNTVEQYDPVTGESGDALGESRESGLLPKVFIVNSSSDYWSRGASLLHTDVEGKKDAAIDPNVRIYAIAGRAHGDSRMGIVGRALLTALDQWVSLDIDPPESQIPKISDGSLVSLEQYRDSFPAVPGAQLPDSYYQPYRLNPGPRWRAFGVADNVPPLIGPRYTCLVPQVNADGMEIAGIRLPEVTVPLATLAGWDMRSPSFSRTLRRNGGKAWPLPLTIDERMKKGDPRKSLEERYPTGADYVTQVSNCLADLHSRRFLLDEDTANLLKQAILQAELLESQRSGHIRFIDDIAIEHGADSALDYFLRIQDAEFTWVFGLGWNEFVAKINARGYELMSEGKLEAAFEVFRANTLIFSANWNVWGSMAECCLKMSRFDLARECSEKSLALNPRNDSAIQMLEKLKTR